MNTPAETALLSGLDGLRFNHWYVQCGGQGVIVLNLDRAQSTLNTLTQAVLLELEALIERLAIDPPRGVILRSRKPDGFIAGADLQEFQQLEQLGQVNDALVRGQTVLQKLAELPCPTVAVIDGYCLGGGTELALACRYRIASDKAHTHIGLPEIRLGIFPGWGGSARLPYLIGAIEAMTLMLSGQPLSARAAADKGLIDKVVAVENLMDQALKFIRQRPARPLSQRLNAWLSNTWLVRPLLAWRMRNHLARKLRRAHYPAPYALIDTWERSGGADINTRLAAERQAVAALVTTPTARNLIRIFFLRQRLKALTDTPCAIGHVHVVGAGTMGADIAAWAALKGFSVSVQEADSQRLETAMAQAQTLLNKQLCDAEKSAAVLARLRADTAGKEIAQADVVIEAINENVEAKRALHQTLQTQMKADAILVSTTSSIPLATLCQDLPHPDRFAGLHFFNPVTHMPLVEMICHQALNETAQQRLIAFCRVLDKLPLPVAGTPGFLVNRVLFSYLLEAVTAYNEGIPGIVIDRAAVAFGMPVGPLELLDRLGLDVAVDVAKVLAPRLNVTLPAPLDAPLGARGKKDGRGIYVWQNGRAIKPDVPKGYRAPSDVEERLILPLLNEAVACLAENVVADADLLDVGLILATGFAPFRGGPIHYIRSVGVERLLESLHSLQTRYGERFAARSGWDNPLLRQAPEDKAITA